MIARKRRKRTGLALAAFFCPAVNFAIGYCVRLRTVTDAIKAYDGYVALHIPPPCPVSGRRSLVQSDNSHWRPSLPTISSFPICSLCNEAVEIETAKTDENGDAVHEECYVLKIQSRHTTVRTKT